MSTLIVKANKIKTCEKCGGHWAWRETKAGKFYPANAVFMGDQPMYGRYKVTHETIYHVNILSHAKFCDAAIREKAETANWVNKNVEAVLVMIEQAKAMNVPNEVIEVLQAKIEAYKAGA